MEKQKMQFKTRNVGFIVPIGLYLLFVGMLSWGSVVSARSFSMGVMATWGMAIPVLTILSLFCSYLFFGMITCAGKNKVGKVATEITSKGYCSTKNMYYFGLKLHVVAFRRKGTIPFPEMLIFSVPLLMKMIPLYSKENVWEI